MYALKSPESLHIPDFGLKQLKSNTPFVIHLFIFHLKQFSIGKTPQLTVKKMVLITGFNCVIPKNAGMSVCRSSDRGKISLLETESF